MTPTETSDHSSEDHVLPDGKWAFDAEVASCFDNMLARSIPQYDVMRRACFSVGRRFVRPGTDVLDLGCSCGGALQPFISHFGATVRYFGVEISPEMLAQARARLSGWIDCGRCRIESIDLRQKYPEVQASLTLCVLTLQFTPIEYRQQILGRAFDHATPGGAIILVEKILGGTAASDSMLADCYYDLKRENGYSQEQIERKRLSLEGVLVPVTAEWNEELLQKTGFTSVECFWRWMNFAAWVAVKPT